MGLSYYRLRQLRCLRRSLDSNSLATLVYAIVNSQTDYCKVRGQVTACVERCCACHHRHLEVWPRPGSDTARKTSLAPHPRPGVIQAGSDSSPVSERPHTTVPVSLLYSSRQFQHSTAPAFHQPSTACSTSLPVQHLRPSGLFSCRPQSGTLPDFIRDPTISADSFRRLLKTYLFARY